MAYVEELKRSVYTYFDSILKEISVISQPADSGAWVSTIAKSPHGAAPTKDAPMPKPGDLKWPRH